MPMRKSSEVKLISVIIPTYRAERIIEKTLIKVKEVLDKIRYNYEIICIVDGIVDKTLDKAKRVSLKYPKKIKVYGYKQNFGKGHAVRYGMGKARGDLIAFVDAGLEINPNSFSMLLEHFEWYNADIIVGSKRHPASKVVYPRYRRILSFGYQFLVRILFGLKVRDTQVGMKIFRKDVVQKILPRLLVKAYAFDIEMLAVANYLGFKRIYEAPVELRMHFGGVSTIASKGFLKTIWSMLWDTLAVFYRLKILEFYHYKNRKRWIMPDFLISNHK